ncbi:MAG: hypothetical protein RL323_1727 [Pseudomonadota bacterium]|jgi:transcriptional antiterminator RfaH
MSAIYGESAHFGVSTAPWFLVYTKPKSESIALENLRVQGYEAWLPCVKKLARGPSSGSDLGLTQGALFPRYVFFRPAHHQQSIAPARSTRGVCNMVKFGHEPAALPHHKLVQIARWVDEQQLRGPVDLLGIQVGQSVKIASGPLSGLNALVKMTEQERVIVLLEMMGKEHTVAVPYFQFALSH